MKCVIVRPSSNVGQRSQWQVYAACNVLCVAPRRRFAFIHTAGIEWHEQVCRDLPDMQEALKSLIGLRHHPIKMLRRGWI